LGSRLDPVLKRHLFDIEQLKAAAPLAARVALALMGIGILVVGLRAAWLTKSATAEIVVGAVFVVLAFIFTRDLEQLFLKYGGTEVGYQRTPSEQILLLRNISTWLESIVTARPAEGADAQVELERVRREVGEVAVVAQEAAETDPWGPELMRARKDKFPETRAQYLRQQFKDGWAGEGVTEEEWIRTSIDARPHWSYSVTPEGARYRLPDRAAHLTVTLRWWGDWRILIIVTDPTGRTTQRRLIGSVFMQGNNFVLTYPSDTAQESPLTPGTYVFRSARISAPTVEGSEPYEVVATDYVEITKAMLDGTESVNPEVRRE
jgi:hypothetical protein